MDWVRALALKKPQDTGGIRGRLRLAVFKHRRRNLEAELFAAGPIMLWHAVKQENTEMRVWK